MTGSELETLLGDGNDPGWGPIEVHLHALATERQLPDLAIAVCTARFEEAAPALRAVLVRAANGETLSDDEEMLAFRGLYILGAARDKEACRPLLRLLRRPEPEVDDLLGDAITEGLPKIIAGVFDGDVDALFGAVSDRSTDQFIRDALFGAATFLAWEGTIPRDRMQLFLEQFHQERQAADGDYSWIGWLEAIALLGLRSLAPLVHSAWNEGRIPEGILNRSHSSAISPAPSGPLTISLASSAPGWATSMMWSRPWIGPAMRTNRRETGSRSGPTRHCSPWRRP